MTIHLISTDADVLHVCEEFVGLFAGPQPLALQTYEQAPEDTTAEGVWIHDVTGAAHRDAIPRLPGTTGILLVDHATLKQWKPALLESRSEVLLKPISRARLEMALSRFIQGSGSAEGEEETQSQLAPLEGLVQRLLRLSLDYQETDRDRSHFIGRAVHELRGPLTSLVGYCDLVLERRLGPVSSQQDTVVSRMRRSLSRLSAIVDVMEQLTNRQSDAAILAPLSEVSYTECVENALQELAPVIVQRKMELSLDLAPCPGTVRADAEQMEEVFLNLLDNSCKYAPRGGKLRISGYPYRYLADSPSNGKSSAEGNGSVPDSYRVDISDNGPGIAAERLGQIFGETIAVARGNDRSGSGLGLAICKMIVRRHRGWIWAESSDQGTTFSIVLPVTQQ